MEEHELTNVLNQLPEELAEEAFNELFTGEFKKFFPQIILKNSSNYVALSHKFHQLLPLNVQKFQKDPNNSIWDSARKFHQRLPLELKITFEL